MTNPTNTNQVSNNSNSKSVARKKRTAKGIKFVALGALVGFSSCVCSLCNPVESFYYINLYGVASVAILMAFYGLYLIFE